MDYYFRMGFSEEDNRGHHPHYQSLFLEFGVQIHHSTNSSILMWVSPSFKPVLYSILPLKLTQANISISSLVSPSTRLYYKSKFMLDLRILLTLHIPWMLARITKVPTWNIHLVSRILAAFFFYYAVKKSTKPMIATFLPV